MNKKQESVVANDFSWVSQQIHDFGDSHRDRHERLLHHFGRVSKEEHDQFDSRPSHVEIVFVQKIGEKRDVFHVFDENLGELLRGRIGAI